MIGVAVSAVGGIGDHGMRSGLIDDRGDIPGHGGDIGRAQRLGGHRRGRPRMTIGSPLHAGILETARFAAEEQVPAHTQGRHRLGDLGLPDLCQTGAVPLEPFELGGDDLPALTSRGGEDGDLGTFGDQGRDRSSGRDRLIVGMSVHEEDAGNDGHRVLSARGHAVGASIRRSGDAASRRSSPVPSGRARACGCAPCPGSPRRIRPRGRIRGSPRG